MVLAVNTSCWTGGWGNGSGTTSGTLLSSNSGCHVFNLSESTTIGGFKLERNSCKRDQSNQTRIENDYLLFKRSKTYLMISFGSI